MGRVGNRADNWVGDELGVSPVIGVILMVAVTVIIAAVIGSTALGITDEVGESPPRAQFEAEMAEADYPISDDYGAGEIDVIYLYHQNGEKIDLSNLKITIDGNEAYTIHRDEDPTVDSSPSGTYWGPSDVSSTADKYPDLVPIAEFFEEDETLSAGDSIPLLAANTDGVDMENNAHNIYYLAHIDDSQYCHRGQSCYGADKAGIEAGAELQVIWESDRGSQLLYEGTV